MRTVVVVAQDRARRERLVERYAADGTRVHAVATLREAQRYADFHPIDVLLIVDPADGRAEPSSAPRRSREAGS
jgi:NAD(P)-dependent dehydrogenase (short-subunit alcohol dehydrogenase family)